MTSRRPFVVVNAAEGEPASAKDSALLDVAPHLVLDGAVIAARAIGAREVHVVSSADRPWVGAAVRRATTERDDHGIRWVQHEAASRFVSGQSRALIELMAGRPGLPVTSWAPEAVDGHRRRPTLLSNAESYAHLAAVVLWGVDGYAAHGTADEPGTSLLTLTTPPGADGVFRDVHVVEVEHGADAASVLDADALHAPLLVGGFHGSWVHPARRAPPCAGRAPCSARSARASAPVPCCRSATARARCRRRRATPTTSPASRPGGADRAATGCPPWPTRCAGWPTAPTPGAGCASWPGWSPGAARAPTPTARPAWSARCSRRCRTTSRPTSTATAGASTPRAPGSDRARRRPRATGGAAMSPRETLLKVDWPQCRARGLCAELLPERIQVDEWGYPVVLGPVRPEEERLAREAVSACPRRALHLRTT